MSERKKKYWKPMVSAPRDGSVIIAVHTDGSGVMLIFWGEMNDKRREESWIEYDSWEVLGLSDEYFGGWIRCPVTGSIPETMNDVEIYPASRDQFERNIRRAETMVRIATNLEKTAKRKLAELGPDEDEALK